MLKESVSDKTCEQNERTSSTFSERRLVIEPTVSQTKNWSLPKNMNVLQWGGGREGNALIDTIEYKIFEVTLMSNDLEFANAVFKIEVVRLKKN